MGSLCLHARRLTRVGTESQNGHVRPHADLGGRACERTWPFWDSVPTRVKRRACRHRLPIQAYYLGDRASVQIGHEAPIARVPRERIAVRRRLHPLQRARRNIDEQLLIEGYARQRLRPETLELSVDRAF